MAMGNVSVTSLKATKEISVTYHNVLDGQRIVWDMAYVTKLTGNVSVTPDGKVLDVISRIASLHLTVKAWETALLIMKMIYQNV